MRKIILKGSRVTLRPFQLSDAPIFYKWFKDKTVTKYLMAPPPKNFKEELSFVRKNQRRKNGYNFAVINEDQKLVGSVGIGFDYYGGTAVLGILIGERSEWGKGYGTEAMQLLIKLAFANKKIHRVELKTAVANGRALKVYKKVGFKTEGILRQASRNPALKRFDDEYVMSILRSEYNRLRIK